jgi:hypothetical protein
MRKNIFNFLTKEIKMEEKFLENSLEETVSSENFSSENDFSETLFSMFQTNEEKKQIILDKFIPSAIQDLDQNVVTNILRERFAQLKIQKKVSLQERSIEIKGKVANFFLKSKEKALEEKRIKKKGGRRTTKIENEPSDFERFLVFKFLEIFKDVSYTDTFFIETFTELFKQDFFRNIFHLKLENAELKYRMSCEANKMEYNEKNRIMFYISELI